MLMHRALIVSFAIAVLMPLSVDADGPPKRTAKRAQAVDDYSQRAKDAYGEGYAFIERATRLDHDASTAQTEAERADVLKDAALAYEDALDAFERAVRSDARMYEAYTYIGYANRKLGRYEPALSAYATALKFKPDYARAIQYQGEAFLGLNRFEEAKRNYLRLYALDGEQAQKLLNAMHRWLDEHAQKDAAEVNGPLLAEAKAWLATQPKPSAHIAANPQSPW